jgi:hypothetical protein
VAAVKYHDEFHMLSGLQESLPPTAEGHSLFAAHVASKSDPDLLTYDQAIRDVDADYWKLAMNSEIMSLIRHGTWVIVKKAAALSKILPGTWTLIRKRLPDGTLLK